MITIIPSRLVSRDPPKVGHPGDRLGELLDLVKVVSHGGCLPYLWLISHDGSQVL